MKLSNKKGFTLMEMLIVVAIIAILIAIAIPVFSSALEKAREAADISNVRAAYAEAMVKYLDSGSCTVSAKSKVTQTNATWQYVEWPEYLGPKQSATATKTAWVTIDSAGSATVTFR